jgi:hypothetical protein
MTVAKSWGKSPKSAPGAPEFAPPGVVELLQLVIGLAVVEFGSIPAASTGLAALAHGGLFDI